MRVLHINISYIVSALHQTMIEHLNQTGVESKVFVPTYDKNRSIVDCKEYVTLSECFKNGTDFSISKTKKDNILCSGEL